ncbi:MAG: hypothetical protein KZQ64_13085 [gamma proteobacterium symbiont of Bathyaustriella thionipta]|nr:hypothetical protein [gamma proteobacterium symbiont of Bathyaustriella thionipta]MCU7948915.1 hypothetical protein [gamma proteobacterium symbiont of Bathyaustriella thionipta]MCU7954304.1 hypothetical protein [gamma proteobacterium symbiont of Bathyaustriella thionipta]MCU7955622.1 hypothetical protein [gamma proteobacterium symbiont of Bathyaustriella thionipta]MCU7966644.1 hypothetical protein [gamma proteobacterium symbiont of Bathyaustriella thionipta]
MKKIVIALFILSITLFAVIKGSLWYFTNNFVDNQIVQAKPFAQISYKEIKSSFTGSVTINGVKVYIPLIDENINIESIKLIAPDLQTLLTLDNQLQNNELPDSLTLLISGISLNLHGNLMKMLNNPEVEPTPVEALSTLACGDIYRIGSNELSKMGYDTLSNDIIFKYHFNPRNNTLNYDIRNNIHDMARINLSGALHGVSNLNSLTTKKARFGKMSLEIIDESYIEQKNKFCANQGNRNVNDYINEHNRQVKEYLLSYGVRPEEGLLNAYQTLLETHGSLIIEANLIQLTGTEEIISFEPNDIIQFVQLQLYVNGERINEISIDIDKDKLIETATSDDIAVETPNEIKKKQAIIIKKYRPVSAVNLQNFNGFRVKIETKAGKHFKGTINTKNPRIYEVISRLRSGNISYFVPVNTIKKAEVFN